LRTVLVTGHSKGIGLAISESLLRTGHCVVGVARSKIEDRDNLHQYSVDLSELDSIAAFTKSLLNKTSADNHFNTIDAVVCNAGAGLVSPLVLLRALLPTLKKHKRSDIVFIASESAVQGGRYGSIYSAAKFGLRGAAQSLRVECASSNCHVGIVNPGMVKTGFFNELSFEPGEAWQHSLQANDVATAVMAILNSPDNAVLEEINVRPLQHVVQKKPDGSR